MRWLPVLMLAALLLQGCGLKGPLYLPTPQQEREVDEREKRLEEREQREKQQQQGVSQAGQPTQSEPGGQSQAAPQPQP